MINHEYIRIEPLPENASDAKISLAKMFTEKQIAWNNKVIDAYLDRTATFTTLLTRG